jgi:threonyl-tRNA synthetase
MDDDDHRAIGNRQGLFHQQEEGPGMVFWHPKGAVLWRIIEDDIRRRMRDAGFHEVRTPQLLARSLWEASGHWEKFGEGMFIAHDGERAHALKPMSCPGHVQVFAARLRSWRELPLRLCEFGACHRNEPSGALHGLKRTRAFVQDDAHIFCEEADVVGEVARFCALLAGAYADYGFPRFDVGFSTRPARRAGSDETWDRAEAALAAAAAAAGLEPRMQAGEGAFYGPKLEFILEDSLQRAWQCGTIQLDFVLPERLGATFIDREGAKARPVMIHHAVLGSIERFIAVLLEHHGGHLPLWLAPEQVAVAPVSEAAAPYAAQVAEAFGAAGLRCALWAGPDRLSRKVVAARQAGIPVLAAVGARDERLGAVSLRRRDGSMADLPLAQAAAMLAAEARSRGDERAQSKHPAVGCMIRGDTGT